MITNTITQIRDKTTKKQKQKTKTNQQTIIKKKQQQQQQQKNNRKVKAMGKITPTMDHYPRNG